MSTYFCKKSALFGENSTFTQSNSVRAVLVRDFLVLFSVFVRYYLWKCKFYRLYIWKPGSELLQINHKLEKWQRRHNFQTWTIVKFFWRFFVSLVKFSCCSKFHTNTITCSGVMTIFFYKKLTGNPEIRNTPVRVLSNTWSLVRIRDTKFGTNVSNEILLNATKCQGDNFYHFWVIKGKPTGG